MQHQITGLRSRGTHFRGHCCRLLAPRNPLPLSETDPFALSQRSSQVGGCGLDSSEKSPTAKKRPRVRVCKTHIGEDPSSLSTRPEPPTGRLYTHEFCSLFSRCFLTRTNPFITVAVKLVGVGLQFTPTLTATLPPPTGTQP